VATPQTEKGYVRIANELLDALLRYPFKGHEFKVVFCIVRETYGWNRKTARTSFGTIARLTGISRRQVIRICKTLMERSIVTRVGESECRAHTMGIVKDYEKWVGHTVENSGILQKTSDTHDTRASDPQDTSCRKTSDTHDTITSDTHDTPSKTERHRLKTSERQQDRLKKIAGDKSAISRLIAGNEACLSNCDPRPVIKILQKAGFDVLRVWGAVMQCKRSRITNPAGYLVKLMADPQYMPADCFLDMGKQEMLRWEQREKSVSAGSVSERSVVAGAELVGALAEKFNART